MKSPDQAAALIQARWKGRQYRDQRRRYVESITKLQARQRGRAVRREFIPFRAFRREQHAFEVESKARRARIWQHQQQLQYMESISPVQYDRLMALQKRRGARLIQRRWKEYTLSTRYQRSMSQHLLHPWDDDAGVADVDENALVNSTESAPSLASKAVDPMVFLAKKQAIHQHVQEAVRHFSAKHPWKIPVECDSKAASDAARRATYAKLQQETANWTARLNEHRTKLRHPKQTDEASVASTLARCEHRLQKLLARSVLPSMSDTGAAGPLPPLPKDRARRDAAVAAHKAVVHSIEEASKAAYTMPMGGCLFDMRQLLPPPPWEIPGQDKIWTWPHSFRVDVSAADPTTKGEAPADPADDAIYQFLTRSRAAPTAAPASLGSTVDSDQLWLHYAEATTSPPSTMLGNVSSVMASHPALLACQAAAAKTGGQDDVFGASFDAIVRSKTKHLVADITNQMTFNTQLRSVQDQTKRAMANAMPEPTHDDQDDIELVGGVDYGGLRRQHMATRIQRRVRGNKGRAEAQEIRAKYFVQVKGRAVRKGLCEECGDCRAVLQCDECQETSHFCPQCWVQVHSTRRRKTHVPKPMAVETAAALPHRIKPTIDVGGHHVGSVTFASQAAAPVNPDIEDILSAALAPPGAMAMPASASQPPVADVMMPPKTRQKRMKAQVTPFDQPATPPSRHPSTVVVAADAMLLGLVQQVADEQTPVDQ